MAKEHNQAACSRNLIFFGHVSDPDTPPRYIPSASSTRSESESGHCRVGASRRTRCRCTRCIGWPIRRNQGLIRQVMNTPPQPITWLDLSQVRFIRPYGAVVLLCLCRCAARKAAQPIGLTGLRPDVHAYLRRIDFFIAAQGVAVSLNTFGCPDFTEKCRVSTRSGTSNVQKASRSQDRRGEGCRDTWPLVAAGQHSLRRHRHRIIRGLLKRSPSQRRCRSDHHPEV
jgi:hypothetical protein